MNVPSYLLKRPPIDDSNEVEKSFGRLYADAVIPADGSRIDYPLRTPKWQFLNYLCEHKDVVVHGSGDTGITEFEPRQSNDAIEFGNQQAVYAASDGIWASYYAVLDRDRYVRSLVNTCHHFIDDDGGTQPYYYFSINEDALPHEPWRTGSVYILPRKTFEGEPVKAGRKSTHWRSFEAVTPLAQLTIGPEDFPFLDQIRGHNTAEIMKRAEADPNGFPWIEG